MVFNNIFKISYNNGGKYKSQDIMGKDYKILKVLTLHESNSEVLFLIATAKEITSDSQRYKPKC